MLVTNPKKIDFSKYNRLFTIGCSFTHWIWPTWADVIAKNHDIEHYNFGVPGQGNVYILTMLSQITRKYHLGDQDLVIIMFSTWHRINEYNAYTGTQIDMKDSILEDSPLKEVTPMSQNWRSGPDLIGEQLLQQTYSSCDRGYAILNYALIDSISAIIESSQYTGAYMQSVAPHDQGVFDSTAPNTYKDDVHNMYKLLAHKQLGKPMYDFLGVDFENKHKWRSTTGNTPSNDYHPYPTDYCHYLEDIGFDISDRTHKWLDFVMKIIHETDNPQTLNDSESWPFSWHPTHNLPL